MAKKLRQPTIDKIKLLRSQGYSLPEIGKELNISKTSVLRYIQGVQIHPEYLSEWISKRGGSKKVKIKKELQALEEAKALVGQLTNKEKMLFLSALYWAEGNKKDFILSNTDPFLIKVFVEFMRNVFKLRDDQFHVSIRLYEDLDRERCLSFWSEVVKIPKPNLKGVNILQGKKKGKLEYGMCRVRIARGGDLLKKVKAVNTAVYEGLAL